MSVATLLSSSLLQSLPLSFFHLSTAPVTASQLLVRLIQLVFTSHFTAQPHTQEFCPANLVMTLFYEIALSSRCCKDLVCVVSHVCMRACVKKWL